MASEESLPTGSPQEPTPLELVLLDQLRERARLTLNALDALDAASGDSRYPAPAAWNLQGTCRAIAEILIQLGAVTDAQLAIRVGRCQVEVLDEALQAALADAKERGLKCSEVNIMMRPQG